MFLFGLDKEGGWATTDRTFRSCCGSWDQATTSLQVGAGPFNPEMASVGQLGQLGQYFSQLLVSH